jgi:hypothetical protein
MFNPAKGYRRRRHLPHCSKMRADTSSILHVDPEPAPSQAELYS